MELTCGSIKVVALIATTMQLLKEQNKFTVLHYYPQTYTIQLRKQKISVREDTHTNLYTHTCTHIKAS